MLFEKFLFPAPSPPNYTTMSHVDHLFWLPKSQNPNEQELIPSMFYSPSKDADFLIIWCHGNGCDIGSMHSTSKAFASRLNSHLLIFEYPSYGLSNYKTMPNEKTINEYAECAYSFVVNTLKWPTDRIILYGHSIGSGPACYLASRRSIGALILQSPFTSINDIVREKIGILSSLLSTSFWDNLQAIKNITIPVLFIHGLRDHFVPAQHSKLLYNSLNNNSNKELILLPDSHHNSMYDRILLTHIEPFLNKYFPEKIKMMFQIELDPILFQTPKSNKRNPIRFFVPLYRVSTASLRCSRTLIDSMSSSSTASYED